MTSNGDYEIHTLRLFPYSSKESMVAEHWICKQKIKSKLLPATEISNA
jgi:hypothetical protein